VTRRALQAKIRLSNPADVHHSFSIGTIGDQPGVDLARIEDSDMSLNSIFSRPELLALLIPIVAIIVWGIVTIVKMFITHTERMALIDRGIHPDQPSEDRDQTCE